MGTIASRHIVFVTGCFVNHEGWSKWKEFFGSKGYTCSAPPWPHREGTAEALRKSMPNPYIAATRLSQVVEHFAGIAQGLPEKPILIGHSMGGLITQILVNRDLAAAGVAVHSVPPQGIVPIEFSFYRSTWRSLGYFTSTRNPYLMSLDKWRYAFTNGLSNVEQEKAYEANCIPESKLLIRDGLTKAAHVDFAKPHPPLLILAGSTDHCVPASLNHRNFKKYKQNGSVVDFKELPNRSHYVLGLPSWTEDAQVILDWLQTH